MNSYTPVILARPFEPDIHSEDEFIAAKEYFPIYTQRNAIPKYSLVIGRYSVLPYYFELEEDIHLANSVLINTYSQHQFMADIFQWYPLFKKFTPTTWHNVTEIPENFNGPFVIKGVTNSRKHEWNKRMFAKTKDDIGKIINTLLDDSLLSQQGLCIRKYIPLKTYFTSINDLPVTQEYRFFCFDRQILSAGFYWSSCLDDLKNENLEVPNEAYDFVKTLINLDKSKFINFPRFFVLDVAKTKDNNWILVEMNDAQMSGLSENKPKRLYKELKKAIEGY